MSEFTTGKVVLLFSGAAVVSVMLIFLLNAEANNRRVNREPQIAEGNMFSVLGNQVKHVVKRWVDNRLQDDSSRLSPAVPAETVASKRHLMALSEPQSEPQLEPQSEPQRELHVRRHAKHRHTDDASTTRVEKSATVGRHNASATGVSGEEPCFTTRQVLMVIAVTCAVNFAFVLLIIGCVRICYPGPLDNSAVQTTAVQSASRLYRRSDASYNSVQEYVDSLLPSPDSSMWSLDSCQRAAASSMRHQDKGKSASMEALLFV